MLLTPPTDKAGIKTEIIPGLQADHRADRRAATRRRASRCRAKPAPRPASDAGAGRAAGARRQSRRAEPMTAVPVEPGARAIARLRALLAHVVFSGAHRRRGGGAQQAAREPHVARHPVRRRVGDRDARDRQRRRAGDPRADEAARREQHRHHADRRAEGREGREGRRRRSSRSGSRPGLSYLDAQAIKATIPAVGATSSEVVVNSVITREGHHRSGKVVGVDSSYFEVMNLQLAEGAAFAHAALHARVAGRDHRPGREVALLHDRESRSATRSRSATQWLTVVGVLEDRKVSARDGEAARHSRREHGRLRAAADDAAALSAIAREVTQSEMELAAQRGQLRRLDGDGRPARRRSGTTTSSTR